MDDETVHAPVDPITRLPWSVALRVDGATWITRAEIHAVCVQVAGLGTLMDVFGYRAGHSILAQVARLLKLQLDERDLLGRHSGDRFLILTQRPYDEIKLLVNRIRDRVFTLSIETAEGRVPEGRFGVAGADPVANPADANAALDALIISAEIALQTRGQIEPRTETAVAAPAAVEHVETRLLEKPAPEPMPITPPVPEPEPMPAPAPALEQAPIPTPTFESTIPVRRAEAVQEEVRAGPEMPDGKIEHAVGPVEPVIPAPAAPPVELAPVAEERPVVAAQTAEEPRPAAAAREEAEAPAVPPPGEAHRVSLVRWNLAEGGQSATVEVEVQYGERHAVGRVVGRNAPDRIPYLVGEATARALTELLPQGYGVILQDIQSVSHGEHQALWVAVMLMSPAGEEKLLGIAPGNENRYAGTARAVLNAINRRLSLVLNQAVQTSADH